MQKRSPFRRSHETSATPEFRPISLSDFGQVCLDQGGEFAAGSMCKPSEPSLARMPPPRCGCMINVIVLTGADMNCPPVQLSSGSDAAAV